jgi:hypothetical protein
MKKKIDESLFWVYELYYSGFELEVFDILIEVLPLKTNLITKYKNRWLETHNETIIGTIIINIIAKNKHMNENELEKYKTIINIPGCVNWNFLKHVSRFKARRRCIKISTKNIVKK